MAVVQSTLGNAASPPEQRKQALTTLVRLARSGSTIVWNDNFLKVLRWLFD